MICQWIEALEQEITQAWTTTSASETPYASIFRYYVGRIPSTFVCGKKNHLISFEYLFRLVLKKLIKDYTQLKLPSQFKLHLQSKISEIHSDDSATMKCLIALTDFFSKIEEHYESKAALEVVPEIPGAAKIHRIWVGRNPGRDAIVSMAATNMHISNKWFKCPCEHYLWTDNQTLLNLPKNTPALRHFKVRSLDSLLTEEAGHPAQIINKIVIHCKALLHWREYSLVSDLLRQAILIKHGGMYIDASWQLPLTMTECDIPIERPTLDSIYLASLQTKHGPPVMIGSASNFSNNKTSYPEYLKSENDSLFSTYAERMNKSLIYIGRANHIFPIKVAEYILEYFRHNSLPCLAKTERDYRFFKHTQLLKAFANNTEYKTTSSDIAFIAWLDQTPFQKAIYDLDMYQVELMSMGVFFKYRHPKAFWISCKEDKKYQYRASFGLAKKWSLSWQKADLKDLPYVEWV